MDFLAEIEKHRALYLMPEKTNGDVLAATTWDDFHGQANVKRTLAMFIESARKRGERLDHVLLAAPAGLGKTTLAQIIAAQMGSKLVQCQLPIDANRLINTIRSMASKDVLFLDEAHLIGQKKGTIEAILPVLIGGRTIAGEKLPDVTIVAATTDKDTLPTSFLSRFPIKPYFDEYTTAQVRDIVRSMAKKFDLPLEPAVIHSLAKAANGVPRTAGTLIRHARVLYDNGEDISDADNILRFSGLTQDGLCKEQISYIKTLYRNPKYIAGESVYRMGFTTLVSNMREPKETVARMEQLLVELGYVQHEATGRRLTDKGIALARRFK